MGYLNQLLDKLYAIDSGNDKIQEEYEQLKEENERLKKRIQYLLQKG
jgi:cell division septum initiation protein DivIVA